MRAFPFFNFRFFLFFLFTFLPFFSLSLHRLLNNFFEVFLPPLCMCIWFGKSHCLEELHWHGSPNGLGASLIGSPIAMGNPIGSTALIS